MVAVNPYSTAVALNRPPPTYVPNPDDKLRVQAYSTYTDVYNNVPDAFATLLRTEDDVKSRRYASVGSTLIEATNRYLCRDLRWIPSVPADVTLPDEDQALTMGALDALFRREEFTPKFASMKRWMLVKGDGILHISADPTKPEGTRIRITELLPDTYFPLVDPADAERVVGCYLVSLLERDNATVAQRIEYRRMYSPEVAAEFGAPLNSVYFRLGYFEPEGWDDRPPYFSEEDLKPVAVPEWIEVTDALDASLAGFALPPAITAVPVYHFRNNRRGSDLFGLSELQGLESLLAGVTQNATDEDMAVALAGLGVYWTDSGHPVNAQGQPVPWIIAPASVLEVGDGKKIGRVDGITTVQPVLDHISMLKTEAREATGVPDVAIGKVDVQVAQSGIALAIQFDPLVSKNDEKEAGIKTKLDQMMFDLLNGWLPTYEGVGGNGLVVTSVFGRKLPLNRKEFLEEVALMVENGIIDAEFARELIAEALGIEFPTDMGSRMEAASARALDAVGSRLDAELEGAAEA